MWVITRCINQYDQDGDYFVCVFDNKPSIDEIKTLLKCTEEYAKHVQDGGGRIEFEDTWYFLTEMRSGEVYSSLKLYGKFNRKR